MALGLDKMPDSSVRSAPSQSSILPSNHQTSSSTSSNQPVKGGNESEGYTLETSLVRPYHSSPESQSIQLMTPDITMDFKDTLHSKREFICGSGAAFVNICITFPINKAIFRQQLHGVSSIRALRQLKTDGLRFLYRGLLPPLLQKSVSMSIMFGSYTKCKELLYEMNPTCSTVSNDIMSALIAGTLEATLAPFERVQTLMQNRHFHDKFANTLDTFKNLRSFGFTEYYRGLSVILLRNGPSNVCFFLGREFLENKGPIPKTQSEKLMKDFICGACLGALISSFYFPFNVVKTRMQSEIGGPTNGIYKTLKLVLSERGGRFHKLFKGVHLNCTRSFISWGIVNASYEFLLHTFFKDDVR